MNIYTYITFTLLFHSILVCLKVPSKDPRRIGLLHKAASRCAQHHEPGLWPAVHVAVHSLCMLSPVLRTVLALGSPLVTVDLCGARSGAGGRGSTELRRLLEFIDSDELCGAHSAEPGMRTDCGCAALRGENGGR